MDNCEPFLHLPRHIGIIPDGNRRWAKLGGLTLEKAYEAGYDAMRHLLKDCQEIGIKEITVYGCSSDNLKRSDKEKKYFIKNIHELAEFVINSNMELLIVGDMEDPNFPDSLREFTVKQKSGVLKVNILTDYNFEWDIKSAIKNVIAKNYSEKNSILELLGSSLISTIDLVIRWGKEQRLSGFLPFQTIYSDLYFFDKLWPEYTSSDLKEALKWFDKQNQRYGL